MKKYIQFLKFLGNSKRIQTRYSLGESIETNNFYIKTKLETKKEINKQPFRFDIINAILSTFDRDTTYLEIGVRNIEDNYNRINSKVKYSVDPGYENPSNPADFKLTSDDFFKKLQEGNILNSNIKFDVIFIDGLHLAEQVEKDIENSLKYLNEDGFLVLHDCNPPTEFHASETYEYRLSPSEGYWNGTVWKAFFKFRKNNNYSSCCIDTDWGVGVISKNKSLGTPSKVHNPYFEFKIFEENKKESLNLMSYEEFLRLIS